MMNKKDFIGMMQKTQAPLVKMIEMIPDDKLEFRPADHFMTIGHLLKHFSDNWSLIRMLAKDEWPDMSPEKMEEMMKLENIPSMAKPEALEAMKKDLEDAIAFMENEVSEEDLMNQHVKAPWGFEGELWKGVLMAVEHQSGHKMQLHLYMKMLGLPVHTGTLYGM